MDSDEIYRELTEVFDEVFGVDDVPLTAETTANDIDGWDSLNHIRLILTVQKRFNVKFTSGEIGDMKNLGDLVQMIQAKS